jgi:hypothetical protein
VEEPLQEVLPGGQTFQKFAFVEAQAKATCLEEPAESVSTFNVKTLLGTDSGEATRVYGNR